MGLGTATVLLGIRLASVTQTPEQMILTSLAALALSFVGGWFGGNMLPPVYQSSRRKRISTTSL